MSLRQQQSLPACTATVTATAAIASSLQGRPTTATTKSFLASAAKTSADLLLQQKNELFRFGSQATDVNAQRYQYQDKCYSRKAIMEITSSKDYYSN
jgi:hypothetical protein